jgi:uncharacterized protein RhaS with RHS repeats
VISWHRFYDPDTGRYISADPIGLDGGINLYTYADGNPVNWIDPTGEYVQAIPVLIIGFGIAIAMHNSGTHVPDNDWPLEDNGEKCKNSGSCKTEHPELPSCSSIRAEGFRHKSSDAAINTMKNELDIKNLSKHSIQNAYKTNGTHVNVRWKGTKMGTLLSKKCCEDTPSGPKQLELWKILRSY